MQPLQGKFSAGLLNYLLYIRYVKVGGSQLQHSHISFKVWNNGILCFKNSPQEAEPITSILFSYAFLHIISGQSRANANKIIFEIITTTVTARRE